MMPMANFQNSSSRGGNGNKGSVLAHPARGACHGSDGSDFAKNRPAFTPSHGGNGNKGSVLSHPARGACHGSDSVNQFTYNASLGNILDRFLKPRSFNLMQTFFSATDRRYCPSSGEMLNKHSILDRSVKKYNGLRTRTLKLKFLLLMMGTMLYVSVEAMDKKTGSESDEDMNGESRPGTPLERLSAGEGGQLRRIDDVTDVPIEDMPSPERGHERVHVLKLEDKKEAIAKHCMYSLCSILQKLDEHKPLSDEELKQLTNETMGQDALLNIIRQAIEARQEEISTNIVELTKVPEQSYPSLEGGVAPEHSEGTNGSKLSNAPVEVLVEEKDMLGHESENLIRVGQELSELNIPEDDWLPQLNSFRSFATKMTERRQTAVSNMMSGGSSTHLSDELMTKLEDQVQKLDDMQTKIDNMSPFCVKGKKGCDAWFESTCVCAYGVCVAVVGGCLPTFLDYVQTLTSLKEHMDKGTTSIFMEQGTTVQLIAFLVATFIMTVVTIICCIRSPFKCEV